MATGKAEDGLGPLLSGGQDFVICTIPSRGGFFGGGDLALVAHFEGLFLFCLYLIGLFSFVFSGKVFIGGLTFFYVFMTTVRLLVGLGVALYPPLLFFGAFFSETYINIFRSINSLVVDPSLGQRRGLLF